MADLEKTLEEVSAGKFDLEKANKRSAAQKKAEAFYQLAAKNENEAEIEKLGKELEALDAELGGINPGRRFNAAEARRQIKFSTTLREYQMALAKNQDDPSWLNWKRNSRPARPQGSSSLSSRNPWRSKSSSPITAVRPAARATRSAWPNWAGSCPKREPGTPAN